MNPAHLNPTDTLITFKKNESLVSNVPIKLLHISDLHFVHHPVLKHMHCLRGHRKDALRALISEAEKLKPDLVFVTGDQTTWGDRRSLRFALRFLSHLLKVLGLGKERLLCVPGNHDVLLHYYRPFPGISRNYDQVFGAPVALQQLSLNGYKLAIFSFDSTLERERRGFLWPIKGRGLLWPIKGSMGRVPDAAFSNFNNACANCQDLKDHLKIALVHHHPLPIPKASDTVTIELTTMSNGGAFIAHMQKSDVEVVLHGHEHIPYSCTYRCAPTSPELVVVAAGTVGQTGNDHVSFNFLQIVPRNRTIVEEFTYSKTGFAKNKDSIKVWPDARRWEPYYKSLWGSARLMPVRVP